MRMIQQAKSALGKIRDMIVKPCPPELFACENCEKLECDQQEWLNCERRQKVAEEIQDSGEQKFGLEAIDQSR